jgi:hypothetical protein
VTVESHVTRVQAAATWDTRVSEIRKAQQGIAPNQQASFFDKVAQDIYAPQLTYSYETVFWRDQFAQSNFDNLYVRASAVTNGFVDVSQADLAAALLGDPPILKVFRTILGYTRSELAEACNTVSTAGGKVTAGNIDSVENGKQVRNTAWLSLVAQVISDAMTSPRVPPIDEALTTKQSVQRDTANGWESVRHAHNHGVRYAVLLNQRLIGGAFRQLQDSTSGLVGGGLETPVRQLLSDAHVPFVRTSTSSEDKKEVARKFGITLALVPDYVIHDGTALRAFLECKLINDGGTARDKAARFKNYAAEGRRLGGIPVLAVLDGGGWRRTGDALGPVIEACEGRVFSLSNVHEMLDVAPLSLLKAP